MISVPVKDMTGKDCGTFAFEPSEVSDVICKQFFIKSIYRGVYGGGLYEYIRAVSVVFHHALYSADLPLDSVKPVYKLFIFLGGTLFFSL